MENSLSVLLESYPEPLGDDPDCLLPASPPAQPELITLSLAPATGETKRRGRVPCDWYDLGVGLMLLASAVSAVYCFVRILQP